MAKLPHDEIERRKQEAMADTSEPVWWWLSFADSNLPKGAQFLGVAIVRGANVYQASQVACHLGCNPGGAVMGEPLDDDEIGAVPLDFRNRLLTKRDIEELKRIAEEAPDAG